MLPFTPHKGACTGCSACMAACPVSCISMDTDDEGFWYPVSTDACINCGRCVKVCPVPQHEKTANHNVQHAYACLSLNFDVWKRSASGGAFSEICYVWGDDETIVAGAAWDGLKVHHVCIEGVQNIAPLCKSKYVASYPENCFREIKACLKKKRKVIFCGTPCQVAGLKSYLGKDDENLLTIDLICHGVGSPSVFQTAVHEMERQMGLNNVHYEFRAKRKLHEADYLTSITDGVSTIYMFNDPYMQLFLKQTCLRPSCGENCVFRNSHRQGDLTIADYKGLGKVFPDLMGTKRNYTAIVTNTKKGERVVSLLSKTTDLRESSIENIGKYNPLFYRQTWFSDDRDAFFKEYVKEPEGTVRRWTENATIATLSMKNEIRRFLPSWVIRVIYKIKKR